VYKPSGNPVKEPVAFTLFAYEMPFLYKLTDIGVQSILKS
jgi:hypothetical protein